MKNYYYYIQFLCPICNFIFNLYFTRLELRRRACMLTRVFTVWRRSGPAAPILLIHQTAVLIQLPSFAVTGGPPPRRAPHCQREPVELIFCKSPGSRSNYQSADICTRWGRWAGVAAEHSQHQHCSAWSSQAQHYLK